MTGNALIGEVVAGGFGTRVQLARGAVGAGSAEEEEG